MVNLSEQGLRPVVLSVNQDAGISPGRAKGAAVHLKAMREAFCGLGAHCPVLDEPDDERLVRALERQLARGPIDLIYERYALGKSVAARFAARHGVPLVLEVNAPLADEQRRWRGGSDEAEDARQDAIAMGEACGVIAVSSDVADYAVGRGADAACVEVFPNGIDTKRFNTGVRQSIARESLVPAGRFAIGFHGRLRPWHGFDLLVEVAVEMLERGHDIHLLVVGEGDFDALERLPEGRYTRIGWQPHEDIPRYVAAFDVLPLTYRPDVPCYFSPLKLMEAMACGVVPLVPYLGDLPRVVDHGRTGFVYSAGDGRQLLAQLEALAADRALLGDLGGGAADEARHHGWSRIAGFALQAAADRSSALQRTG
jgi:glycosyltransferase involved in cell wall biosynthesis